MGSIAISETKPRRQFDWPTVDGAHTVHVKGDNDVGIQSIVFNSEGTQFAVSCRDKSVRIWNYRTRLEVAKLAHTMPVTAVAWMDHDSGVVTLGDNGIVSTWTRNAQNKWQWAKILDARGRQSSEDPACMAFVRDRIAIAFPRAGVKIWLFIKGTWLPQRAIIRQNVTALRFIQDGEALIGGTSDGVLWHCEVPNGTLKALAFLKNKISSIDVDNRGLNALVAVSGGRTHLINIRDGDQRGNVEQVFHISDPELQSSATFDYDAMFTMKDTYVLFGTVKGSVMAWDRYKADVAYGLSHGEDDVVEAIASFDGGQPSNSQLLTGTQSGQLTWFAQPNADGIQQRKRLKAS